MNQTYAVYGGYGYSVEEASQSLRNLVATGFNTAAELTGSATRASQALTATAANRAAVLTGQAAAGASYLTSASKARAQAAAHEVWCRTHPWECFKEKYPNWKWWALGFGGLWLAGVIYNVYMIPSRARRAARYAAPLAEAGAFGPEGMVAVHGARKAGLIANRRRRRTNRGGGAFTPHRRRFSKR